MALPALHDWLAQIRDVASRRAGRLTEALASAIDSEPDAVPPAEAERLGLAFARFITGGDDGVALRRAAREARPEGFWRALEAFTDNIAGEEWRRVSRELLTLPEVMRERRRLRHPSVWRRALAARHLGLLDFQTMHKPLRAAMRRGPALVTFIAALALARLRDRRALRWLLENPHATAMRGRRQLVALLKRFGRRSLDLPRDAVAGWDVEAPIHLAAVEVLGLWRDRESVPRLEALLENGAPEARVAAARALGGIGEHSALPALLAALDDDAWQVRGQAAQALGRIPDAHSIRPLVARVRDVTWWVRRHAAYALALHGEGGRTALEALARQFTDLFAAEMAGEVLQLLDWERESPGGISRVA